jgi:peptide-methionine (S)-S-oxide reductase
MVMRLDTVTFGMGCFWGHEARFGYPSGILRTRVGYARWKKEGQPTSKNTLDYKEVLQVQFNAELLSLGQIVNQFFKQHNITRAPRSMKYRSLLLFENEEQMSEMLQKLEEIKHIQGNSYTSVEPIHSFYEADIRHQKYYLQRWKPVHEKWQDLHLI